MGFTDVVASSSTSTSSTSPFCTARTDSYSVTPLSLDHLTACPMVRSSGWSSPDFVHDIVSVNDDASNWADDEASDYDGDDVDDSLGHGSFGATLVRQGEEEPSYFAYCQGKKQRLLKKSQVFDDKSFEIPEEEEEEVVTPRDHHITDDAFERVMAFSGFRREGQQRVGPWQKEEGGVSQGLVALLSQLES